MYPFSIYSFLLFTGKMFPFAQAPVLEVDGTVIAQTLAIIRYLGNEFGKIEKRLKFLKAVSDTVIYMIKLSLS